MSNSPDYVMPSPSDEAETVAPPKSPVVLKEIAYDLPETNITRNPQRETLQAARRYADSLYEKFERSLDHHMQGTGYSIDAIYARFEEQGNAISQMVQDNRRFQESLNRRMIKQEDKLDTVVSQTNELRDNLRSTLETRPRLTPRRDPSDYDVSTPRRTREQSQDRLSEWADRYANQNQAARDYPVPRVNLPLTQEHRTPLPLPTRPRPIERLGSRSPSPEENRRFTTYSEFMNPVRRQDAARRLSTAAMRPSENQDLMERIAQAVDNPRNVIQMTQQQPSYEHIKLESVTVYSCVRFLYAIRQYTARHSVQLRPTSLISEKARDEIISRNEEEGLDEANFHELDTLQLMRCLQRATRPSTKKDFQDYLERYVRFNLAPGYKFDITNFRPMFDALSQYKRDFLMYYDFMARDNEANIPFCNAKEGGLIKIFISKLPQGYGEIKYSTVSTQKFKHIHEFIDEFWKQVLVDSENSRSARSLSKSFKQSTIPSETFQLPKDTPKKQTSDYEKKKAVYESRKQSFGGIREERAEDSDTSSVHEEEDIKPLDHVDEPQSLKVPSETNSEIDVLEQELEQLQSLQQASFKKPAQFDKKPDKHGSSTKEKKAACFRTLTTGKCENDKCTYSHDEADLKEGFKLLMTQLDGNRERFGQPTTAVRKMPGEPAPNSGSK